MSFLLYPEMTEWSSRLVEVLLNWNINMSFLICVGAEQVKLLKNLSIIMTVGFSL